MGLGLRYCPQHPTTPLVLARSGRFWVCEAEGGCMYTENLTQAMHKRKVIAVNGHAVVPSRGGRRMIAPTSSSVENALVNKLDPE